MAIGKKSRGNKPRKSSNVHITKSGKTIKLHTSLSDRIKQSRDEKALRKAERLRGMPKSRIKRFFFRMHPKRLAKYWFSREGGIMALKITGIGLVSLFVIMIGVFAYFRKDLPNLRDISGNNIGGSIRYYDRTGQTLLWEDYDAVKRIPVDPEEISDYLKQATIALEDRDFYKHGGFDTRGIMRAGWANLTGGERAQGGSTITQQLVKLSLDWTNDKSYTRKIKELIIAVEMERSYSKEEILTGYLNTAPYGNVQYGAEVAAQDYFHKSAKDLTLTEAAFLASIPQSPSYYSPYGAFFAEEFGGETGREALIGRMHYTLNVMADMGFITKEEAEEAKAKDAEVIDNIFKPETKYAGIKAPYFVLAAKEELEKKYGEAVNRSGWQVTTTLDLGLQQIAEEEVAKGVVQVKRQRGDVAAFTAEDVETGQIVAMVGGPDFNNEEYGKYNYARAPLPPGSSFKPYDYSALIENANNVGAGTVIYDTRGPLPGYPCNGGSNSCLRDYDRRYPGPVTLRYALGGSRNVPAVKAMLMAGVETTISLAEDLMNASESTETYGYNCYAQGATEFVPENEVACGGSSAIGDGAYLKMDEHVHGIASISRLGVNIPRAYILEIKDASGKVQDKWEASSGKQVMRPDTAYIISDVLSDPRASYMASKRHNMTGASGSNWKLAMKTGTTNDSKDGWMVGFTTKYAAAVWVGYHDRSRELSGFMETMTQPIVTGWMQRVHRDIKAVNWTKPSGVQTLPSYVQTAHVGASSREPGPSTDLYPSWYEKKNANNKKTTIDVISGKKATECTPELAKKDQTGGSAAQHSGDSFVTGNSDEEDDVHKCTDAKPQTSTVTVNRASGNSYSLEVNLTQGTHSLVGNGDKGGGKVEFKVDGSTVATVDISGNSASANWTPTSSGPHSFTARVIDSVLYHGDSSSSSTRSFLNLTYTKTGGFIKFTSSGFPVKRANGTEVCGNAMSCSSVPEGALPSGTVVYADDGDTSPNVTVTY